MSNDPHSSDSHRPDSLHRARRRQRLTALLSDIEQAITETERMLSDDPIEDEILQTASEQLPACAAWQRIEEVLQQTRGEQQP